MMVGTFYSPGFGDMGTFRVEPPIIEATETYRGTQIMAKRHSTLGHTMGYARVPHGHPLTGFNYDEADECISIHGGVTFAKAFDDDGGFWLGFDSGHAGDGVWTTEQTMDEARLLADQILDYKASS